jgi:hypothetical protein
MAPRRSATPSLFDLAAEGEVAPPLAPLRPGCYARVALNRPVPREFTYAVGEGLVARAAVGSRVAVPFG